MEKIRLKMDCVRDEISFDDLSAQLKEQGYEIRKKETRKRCEDCLYRMRTYSSEPCFSCGMPEHSNWVGKSPLPPLPKESGALFNLPFETMDNIHTLENILNSLLTWARGVEKRIEKRVG